MRNSILINFEALSTSEIGLHVIVFKFNRCLGTHLLEALASVGCWVSIGSIHWCPTPVQVESWYSSIYVPCLRSYVDVDCMEIMVVQHELPELTRNAGSYVDRFPASLEASGLVKLTRSYGAHQLKAGSKKWLNDGDKGTS